MWQRLRCPYIKSSTSDLISNIRLAKWQRDSTVPVTTAQTKVCEGKKVGGYNGAADYDKDE